MNKAGRKNCKSVCKTQKEYTLYVLKLCRTELPIGSLGRTHICSIGIHVYTSYQTNGLSTYQLLTLTCTRIPPKKLQNWFTLWQLQTSREHNLTSTTSRTSKWRSWQVLYPAREKSILCGKPQERNLYTLIVTNPHTKPT